MDFAHLKTLAFMALLCGGNLTIYLTRNEKMFWSAPLAEWKFILATSSSLLVGIFISAYNFHTNDF